MVREQLCNILPIITFFRYIVSDLFDSTYVCVRIHVFVRAVVYECDAMFTLCLSHAIHTQHGK